MKDYMQSLLLGSILFSRKDMNRIIGKKLDDRVLDGSILAVFIF